MTFLHKMLKMGQDHNRCDEQPDDPALIFLVALDGFFVAFLHIGAQPVHCAVIFSKASINSRFHSLILRADRFHLTLDLGDRNRVLLIVIHIRILIFQFPSVNNPDPHSKAIPRCFLPHFY